ncbi:hypothetical protein EVAR_6552_1 [Eumeta japonica]|uniref:Uncharacterized protein n=1 Tax=Eumeta variegata TaxID=151549 RepID=A0A4C1SQW5_EUMVA|nr:hypothetical protein EVAR_6552_1 [Eumeta japonica]
MSAIINSLKNLASSSRASSVYIEEDVPRRIFKNICNSQCSSSHAAVISNIALKIPISNNQKEAIGRAPPLRRTCRGHRSMNAKYMPHLGSAARGSDGRGADELYTNLLQKNHGTQRKLSARSPLSTYSAQEKCLCVPLTLLTSQLGPRAVNLGKPNVNLRTRGSKARAENKCASISDATPRGDEKDAMES